MDKLHDSLLLNILSRLDNSVDVASCRVASKAFNALFPGLRSINLELKEEWLLKASTSDQRIKPFMTVFLDHISKLETVESISIDISSLSRRTLHLDVLHLTDDVFVKVWLPRVSGSLKSLSIKDDIRKCFTGDPSSFLALISEYCCDNLVNLSLMFGWLLMNNLNPMPMLTSLTLESIVLEDDENLNELNKCFPNLQFLELQSVRGLTHPKIHLLNLKTLVWIDSSNKPRPLTIITPNLNTLTITCSNPCEFHIEAPMLSHFLFDVSNHKYALQLKKFEVKTLWLEARAIGSFLSMFHIMKTVETLTLDLIKEPPIPECRGSEFTLGKVFTFFPNVSSLCIRSHAWLELEAACSNPEVVSEILDGREGLKTICAYLMLVDPTLTFSTVVSVLDQCVGLSDVSMLIHSNVTASVFESFRSKCTTRWSGLKWRWGIWDEYSKDSWTSEVKWHGLKSIWQYEMHSSLFLTPQNHLRRIMCLYELR